MKSMRRALVLPLAPLFIVVICSTTQLGCGFDDVETGPAAGREQAASTPKPSAAEATAPDEQAESPSEPQNTVPGDSANLIGELEETVEIGDIYPEDAPLYPGVQPSKLTQAPDGKVTVMMGTDAGPEEAVDVMAAAAEAKGWTILSHELMGDSGSLIIAEKGDRKLRLLVSRLESPTAGEKTLVAVSVDP